MPPEYWRWELAREFGWTLEYVDSLSIGNWREYWAVEDGKAKAAEDNQRKWRKR
jgi:hypothetical protein